MRHIKVKQNTWIVIYKQTRQRHVPYMNHPVYSRRYIKKCRTENENLDFRKEIDIFMSLSNLFFTFSLTLYVNIKILANIYFIITA